jgi:hypothetical protein
MNFARELWLRIETLHAVTYFGEETLQAGRDAGLSGFWMGYFGFRAAPMGRVGSGVVEATFFNFAPAFVARRVPEVWEHAAPEALAGARASAAAATLARVAPEITEAAAGANDDLARAIERCSAAGRPLFAANRRLRAPEDPIAAFWQSCTALREHRGDGHVAALTAAGLDGVEAHVLIAIEQENSPEDLQRTRGWSADDWSAAVERCRSRRLLDAAGALTEAGAALRHDVEAVTDRLALEPWVGVGAREREGLLAMLEPAAVAVARSGLIRYPNPMGLPSVV